MNSLTKDGYIEERQCENNIAYILQDNSMFLPTEYKVLQNQANVCFVKCMKLLYNGKIQFYYLVNEYKALTDIISSIDADSFMVIMSNVIANVLDVKNNGFLSCKNIDISFERIYVDPNTYKVELIYLPIRNRLFKDESAFENEFRTSLVKLISGITTLSSNRTKQFMADLSNGMLSLQELYNRSKGAVRGFGEAVLQAEAELKRREGSLSIIALNAPDRIVINVTKDSFVIGKKAADVDGVVSFNKMISRIHCKITKVNGEYQVTDLQSANGTFINHVRLQPHRPYAIKNGDIIRLANSDFQVQIK